MKGVTNAQRKDDLSSTGVTAGTYGSSTAIPQITVGSDGRISSISTVTAKDTNTTYSAGTGLSLSGTIFKNSGVTGLIAGDGITLSGSTGDITISSNSSLTPNCVADTSMSPSSFYSKFTQLPNGALIVIHGYVSNGGTFDYISFFGIKINLKIYGSGSFSDATQLYTLSPSSSKYSFDYNLSTGSTTSMSTTGSMTISYIYYN